jgi:hypothetical protein
LDALLKLAEAPKAPGWFEARTLARLRREREEKPSYSFMHWKLLRYLGAVACLLVLAAVVTQVLRQDGTAEKTVAMSQFQTQDEQLFAALDAFDSYTKEAKEWNQEPY